MTAWIIFQKMIGNFIYHTFQEGEQYQVKPFLNIQVVKIMADAYEIDFLKLLDKLQIILTETTA